MIGKETVHTIGAWADDTFKAEHGPGVRSQCLKLVNEAVELAIAAGCTPAEVSSQTFTKAAAGQDWHERRPDPNGVGGEIADCGVVLSVIAHRSGHDLGHEVDVKMDTNRHKRQWNVRPDGSAQHTEAS